MILNLKFSPFLLDDDQLQIIIINKHSMLNARKNNLFWDLLEGFNSLFSIKKKCILYLIQSFSSCINFNCLTLLWQLDFTSRNTRPIVSLELRSKRRSIWLAIMSPFMLQFVCKDTSFFKPLQLKLTFTV